jgi:hypothetical protein
MAAAEAVKAAEVMKAVQYSGYDGGASSLKVVLFSARWVLLRKTVEEMFCFPSILIASVLPSEIVITRAVLQNMEMIFPSYF